MKQFHESPSGDSKDLEAADNGRDCKYQLTRSQTIQLRQGLEKDLGQVCAAFRSLCKERDDLVEVCAPWDSPLSKAVQDLGGRAMRLGLHNGYDLSTRKGFLMAAQYLRQHRPRYLHFSPPCFPWSPMMNANQRTPEQRDRLEQHRQTSRKILKSCRKLMELQTQELQAESCGPGHSEASGEQPLRALSWGEESWQHMTKVAGGRFRVDGCEWGMKHPRTQRRLQKSWGWFSTCLRLRTALERKCSHDKGDHALVEGSITSQTAMYPQELCQAFAKCIMSPQVLWSTLFNSVQRDEISVLANDAMRDEDVDDEDDIPNPVAELPEHVAEEAEEAEIPEGPQGPVGEESNRSDIMRKIRIVHANLGHPSREVMLKTLRDANASSEVLELAKTFECPHCRQRGRTNLRRPSAPAKVTEKWHTVSVDTFWWQSPHQVNGQPTEHGVGISFLDEATDFHVASFVRVGPRKQGSISSAEFREHFSRDWIRIMPTPKILRLDDEGCFRDHSLIEWLESKGIQPQVIAGESPWQNGKHSRHLETLKENMSLLALEVPVETPGREILALAVGAKNELHQVRGYTPNQWAFGQAKGRLESYLQNGDNLAVQSSQASGNFEEQLHVVLKARETFLKADAKRRVARAGLFRARRTETFECGNLVYFWRHCRSKGRGNLDGMWHGPGRVVCVERTSDDMSSGASGSIVWVIHGIILYRCSPEQLRHVTAETQEIDAFLHGNLTPSQLLADMGPNMNYRDISADMSEVPADAEVHDEGPVAASAGSRIQAPAPLNSQHTGRRPSYQHDQPQPEPQGEREGPGRGPESGRLQGHGARGAAAESDRARQEGSERGSLREADLCPDSRGSANLRSMAGRSSGNEPKVCRTAGVREATAGEQHRPEDRGASAASQQGPPEQPRQQEREEFREYTSRGRQRDRVGRPGDGGRALPYAGAGPDRHRDEDGNEGHAVPDRAAPGSSSQSEHHDGADAEDAREHAREDDHARAEVSSSARSRSRTPARHVYFAEDGKGEMCQKLESVAETEFSNAGGTDPQSCGSHDDHGQLRNVTPVRQYKTGCFEWQRSRDLKNSSNLYVNTRDLESTFATFLQSDEQVFEIDLQIAPRDVHLERNSGQQDRWKINEKAKRRAEVSFRKLGPQDREDFMKAMRSELGSYLEKEAVEIATRKEIPPERVLPMRWVLTWKTIEDEEGKVVGKKPKARLIIKGFLDPDLLSLKRESPTLSTQNRNLLLSVAAWKQWKVQVGDVKTAFLNADATERDRNLGADPPEEVRNMLNMKPWELFRVLKAVYGLLHAPKVWYDKLAAVLGEMGWIRSRLEPCVFKLFGSTGELLGLIGCHVDDLVCVGEGPAYATMLQKLQESFPFGSWRDAQKESIMFCGCEMKQDPDGTIRLNQERYALGINEVNISAKRKQDREAPLTAEERSQYRAVLGALSWRGTQSAPWLCASVSYLQGAFTTACVEDLLQLNKLVRLQKQHAEEPLVFQAGIQKPVLVTFCDASWASRKDGSSQGGVLTVLADSSVLQGQTSGFSPIAWQSRKLPRVARSSTSAEVQMASSSTDSHEFVKQMMLDWFNPEPIRADEVDSVMRQVESVMVCDSRNLYDALEKIESSGLHLEEKRTAIEVLSIRERTRATGITIRWCDSDQQLADGLSKNNQYEQLISIFAKRVFSLVFDPQFVSAKRKRAASRKAILESSGDSWVCGDDTARKF